MWPGREHQIKLTIPPAYPKEAPAVFVSLPLQSFRLCWPGSGATLSAVRQQVLEALELYQDLWFCLEDMDRYHAALRAGNSLIPMQYGNIDQGLRHRHLWIMDPDKPSYSDCYRRLALGQHCSVAVTLDPERPRARPDLTFLGPETHVKAFRATAQARFHMWDEAR